MADQDYLINFTATGDASAAAAARNVSQAVGDVGEKAAASGGGFGSFTSSVVSFAGKAAVAGAAIKAISTGLEEIAETEGAEIALRKAGVALESIGEAMKAIEDIELFTQDKLQAAQLYGNVMNGRTRELKAMGIELAENATMEEKLAAIEELRRRGQEIDIQRIGTVSGEWARFKKGISEAIETGTRWTMNSFGLTNALAWVNKAVLKQATDLPKLTTEQILAAKSAEEMGRVNRIAAAGLKESEAAVKQLTKAIEEQSAAAKKAQQEAAALDDAQSAAEMEQVNVDEAKGKLTKQQAAEERRRIAWEQKDRELGAKRDELNQREKMLQAEEEAAKGIVQPGDEQSQRLGTNDEGILGRIRERDARLGNVQKEREALAREKEINSKQARLNDLRREGDAIKESNEEKERIDKAVDELLNDIDAMEKKAADRRSKAEEKKTADEKKRREEQQKGVQKLADEIEKRTRDEEAQREKEAERDRSGRKKIKAPASPNELQPLPDRTGPATDKLKDTTQEAAKKAETNLKDTTAAVNRNTQAVVAFAQTTQNAFANVDSKLASLENRIKSNL